MRFDIEGDAINECNDPYLLKTYLSEDHIRFINMRRMVYQKECECLSICDLISKDVSRYVGLDFVAGRFEITHPRIKRGKWLRNIYHCWCLFGDRTLLDCSADQFGLQGIQIIKANDPAYSRWMARDVKPQRRSSVPMKSYATV